MNYDDLFRETACVRIKKGTGRTLKAGGAWIYDNEIDTISGDFENGDLVTVEDFDGYPLGHGFINTSSKLTVRMLSRKKDTVVNEDFIEQRVRTAWEYRKATTDISSCRVIFGEADLFPGLTVDRFESVLVTQTLSLGMERIKDRLSIYNKAVGRDTPKYVFKTEAETFKVPFEMTIRDSSFMPGSTVHVYRLDSTTWDQGTQTNVFSAIKKDVLVAENGDITFPMAEGGTYLVSAKPVISHEGELEEMLFQVKYEQRGNYDELLTYLKDDPNGYFTNLWEAPGHIAAEDEE